MKPIPRSKAKTVLGLLKDVKRVILEEPKRANMGVFYKEISPSYGGPACGTVGCFAGWVCLMATGKMGDGPKAGEILGYDLEYTFRGGTRFSNWFWFFNGGYGDKCESGRKLWA